MAERKSKALLLTLTSVLFLLTALLALVIILFPPSDSYSFSYYLEQSDREIEAGRYRDAREALERAADYGNSRLEWLSLVKRAYYISQEQEDYELYYRFTLRAVKLYRGYEDFWAFHLSSLIWTGRYDDMEKHERRLSHENYPSLKAEIRLIRESLQIDRTLPPYEGVLDRLKRERDAEFYTLIAQISDLDGLKVDAALLWMGLEEKEKARDLADAVRNPLAYGQALSLIYWDNRDWNRARDLLEALNERDMRGQSERYTVNNMLGDIYLREGNWEKADYHYKRSLEIKGEENWKPLVNRSLLYESMGIYKKASQIMFNALEQYGNQREVVTYFLDNWRETYPVRAERIVEDYLSMNPYDADVILKEFVLFPQEMTPEAYHAFLWELFNANTQSENISRYLLWYMIGLGDFEGVNIILERHSREVGEEPDWFSFYRAIGHALAKPPRWEEAEKEMARYQEMYQDVYGETNLSVIRDKAGL